MKELFKHFVTVDLAQRVIIDYSVIEINININLNPVVMVLVLIMSFIGWVVNHLPIIRYTISVFLITFQIVKQTRLLILRHYSLREPLILHLSETKEELWNAKLSQMAISSLDMLFLLLLYWLNYAGKPKRQLLKPKTQFCSLNPNSLYRDSL